MLTIKVERKDQYFESLREDDLGFRDSYDVDATFKPVIDEDGDTRGDVYDMTNMFVAAMKLEGYHEKSIAQAMHDISSIIARDYNFEFED